MVAASDSPHTPRRIQLRRAKGWRKPAGAVVVARPTAWGNPFRVGDTVGPIQDSAPILTRGQAVFLFAAKRHRLATYPSDDEVRGQLAGRDLACWCPLDQPCHADVLLQIANRPVGARMKLALIRSIAGHAEGRETEALREIEAALAGATLEELVALRTGGR